MRQKRLLLLLGLVLIAFSVSLPLTAQVPFWTAEPSIRMGAVDGPGALASVFHVEVGRQGEVLVAQSRPPLISVFDSSGRFLRTLGRAGQGPGEFQALGRIGWTGSTLWAVDAGGRLNLYDADLNFVETVRPPMPEVGGLIRMYPGSIMADGSVLLAPLSFGTAPSAPVMLVSRDGGALRTIMQLDPPTGVLSLDLGQSMAQAISNPWVDHPLWLNAADGRSLVVVERRVAAQPNTAAVRILRIGLGGDTIVDRRVSYAPVPLGAAEGVRTLRSMAERIADNRGVPVGRVEEAVRGAITPPRFYPPVTGLVTGADGTIWLRREADQGTSTVWDVFDAAGSPLGRVRLPTEFRLYSATRDRGWGVIHDELDVPYVQVFVFRRQ